MNAFKPAKGKKAKSNLEKLLAQSSQAILCELVIQLCERKPEIQAQAFEFLHTRVLLSPDERQKAADQVLLNYWKDVKKDLRKIKRSGCQTQAEENKVLRKLDTLSQKAQQVALSPKARIYLMDEAM